MLSPSIFIIGTIIFTLYLIGLIYMINWGHKSQEIEESNDPELSRKKFRK
jgi:cbb3-type cytochrome oxidase subunit 3|tara:strand:+ start:237 stop:386 length:150 start_codon:yes stop_codon:yes gene_type:complete